MKKLQIDCQLAGPWVPPAFGLHLDGLLARSLVDDAMASVTCDEAEDMTYASIIADLPLERHDAGEGRAVWCASQFVPVGWLAQERRYLTAKTSIEDAFHWMNRGVVSSKGVTTIDTVRGIAKNGQAFFTIEHAIGLRAWAVGDSEAIMERLTRIQGVGVKTRIGFGSLLPYDNGDLWKITEVPDDQCRWKRRSSPCKLIDDSFPAVGSWHSPYWQGHDRIWRPVPMRIPAP